MALPDLTWARVTHLFSGAAIPNGAAVVYCIELEAPFSVTGLAAAVRGAWLTSFLPTQSSGISLVRTIVKQGPDDTGPFDEFSGTDVGGVAGAGASSQCSYLIHKVTASGGRRGRGRMYLPGVDEASIGSDGALTGAKVTSLNNAGADLMADLASIAGVAALALEHQPATEWILDDGQPRRVPVGAAPDPTLVTLMAADPTVATQRRRLRG